MKILFWIVRTLLGISLIVPATLLVMIKDDYESDLFLADSAVQATQLANEYMLDAIGYGAFFIVDVVALIVFELVVISYYLSRKPNLEATEKEKNTEIA